mmetsp:Transcript_600/g.1542  ORF Transcript_600/g.1542 Transcript_600/m.1542 type:complete len:293 (-) Transcript_600:1607-2485(-)
MDEMDDLLPQNTSLRLQNTDLDPETDRHEEDDDDDVGQTSRTPSTNQIVGDDTVVYLRQENDRLRDAVTRLERLLQSSNQTAPDARRAASATDDGRGVASRAAAAAASSPSQHHNHIRDHAASGGRGNEPSRRRRGRGVPLEVDVDGGSADGESGGDYASPLSTTTRQNSGRRGSGMFRQLSLSSRRLSETVLSSPVRLICRSSRRFIYDEQDAGSIDKKQRLAKSSRDSCKGSLLVHRRCKDRRIRLERGEPSLPQVEEYEKGRERLSNVQREIFSCYLRSTSLRSLCTDG